MTDAKLYLALSLPHIVGILVNVGYFTALNTRMTTLLKKLDELESRIHS